MFRTGDLAVMHPDGAVAIVDRSKDIIISGGEVSSFSPLLKPMQRIDVVLVKECIKYGYRTRFGFLFWIIVVITFSAELASHPHVLEVSVVARSHIKWGERPMAFVVLHPRHASQWRGRHDEFANDLKEHAKSRLPGFARPEWVEVVLELPVSL